MTRPAVGVLAWSCATGVTHLDVDRAGCGHEVRIARRHVRDALAVVEVLPVVVRVEPAGALLANPYRFAAKGGVERAALAGLATATTSVYLASTHHHPLRELLRAPAVAGADPAFFLTCTQIITFDRTSVQAMCPGPTCILSCVL